EKWFALSVKQTEAKLKTNAATGLSRKAARSRALNDNGKLFYTKTKRPYRMLLDILSDFALILLLITIVASIVFDEGQSPAVVLALAVFSIIISFFYYYRAQRSMESMNTLFRPTAKVIRNGKLYKIDFDNVVVGDVLLLEKGDIIACDARIVTSNSLKVMMRVDKEKYELLEKNAEWAINPNEKNPKEFRNILHAGSVIEEGSARVIAVATGRYTYLGALTGGIAEPYSDNVPAELKKLRKYCSKISMLSMICVLPFCIISLLFGHLSDGEVTLSSAFLTALAITVSTMSQLVCTHFKIFFVSKIKKLLNAESPVAIRTTGAFDKLADIKYLFLLDGASLTDGILHFDRAYTAEGEINKFDSPTQTTKELFEYAYMYRSSDASMLSVGTREPERFAKGLDEFLGLYKLDTEALKIRRPVKSYVIGNADGDSDKVFYAQDGRGMVLSVSFTPDVISQCAYVHVGGQFKRLNSMGIDRFRHEWTRYSSQGKKVLIFTVSTMESGDSSAQRCFIGMIVLREGVDKSAAQGIASLQKSGIKVVSFVGGNPNAPAIPVEAQIGLSADKSDFLNGKVDITYKFGDVSTYYGLNEKDVEALVDYAHSKGESVGVVGFSDYAQNVIEKSDVFVSCSDIRFNKGKKFYEELKNLELSGTNTSASCIQTIKAESDILIQRPSFGKGGLSSLAYAAMQIGVACRNLSVFFKYLLGVWVARICISAVPMSLGIQTLDARHLLLFGFVLDFFALHMFATDSSGIPDRLKSEDFRIKDLKTQIVSNGGFFISVIIASLSVIILPRLIGMIEYFGKFECITEYSFIAAIWLQIGILYYVRYASVSKLTRIFKNKYFIGILIGAVVFTVMALWSNSIGLLFGFEKTPILYFALSFMHLLLFALFVAIFKNGKKKG
ncbi:MAG: cation-transporting P-type ATPase, partial [Ruminococcaceae bacterium]|nr:cation-transporting P-type ATPase [Oscillospiraceae bacterium]